MVKYFYTIDHPDIQDQAFYESTSDTVSQLLFRVQAFVYGHQLNIMDLHCYDDGCLEVYAKSERTGAILNLVAFPERNVKKTCTEGVEHSADLKINR